MRQLGQKSPQLVSLINGGYVEYLKVSWDNIPFEAINNLVTQMPRHKKGKKFKGVFSMKNMFRCIAI